MSDALDPRFVFDRFVVVPENQVAAAAARQVAESPGRSYNPLVVYGPPGTGKTHLLHAIGQRARALEPELVAAYEATESVVRRLTASIQAGTVEELRAEMTRPGLLLLDDLQEIGGKARTQEEVLGVVDALVERGGQVVVVLDRAPVEIPALDARLAARLAAGLIVDIAPPGAESRRALLRHLEWVRSTPLPDGLIDALAQLPIDNVRDLLTGLNRVIEAVDVECRELEGEDVPVLLGFAEARPAPAAPADEFGAFLSDISNVVAAVVETAPWRRRVAEAILRWEAEGVQTRRLEAALDADTAPDVDALLGAFTRDVLRLREIARALGRPAADPLLLRDPDRVREAEALLAAERARPAAAPAPPAPAPAPVTIDAWFLDCERFAWDWLGLDERLTEER